MGKKEFITTITDAMSDILVGNKEIRDYNIELFTTLINSMSKTELDNFVDSLEDGSTLIPLIVPNGSNAMDYEHNLGLFKKYNIDLHKRIIVTEDGVETMSSIPRMVLELQGKKPIQMLDKKRSIPKDTNSTNTLTGQVTNKSKSMSITSPEVPLMLANGMVNSVRELTKYRGGDINAGVVLEKLAENDVEITQEILEKYSSGPEVNNTINQFLLSMHIDSNIKNK